MWIIASKLINWSTEKIDSCGISDRVRSQQPWALLCNAMLVNHTLTSSIVEYRMAVVYHLQ